MINSIVVCWWWVCCWTLLYNVIQVLIVSSRGNNAGLSYTSRVFNALLLIINSETSREALKKWLNNKNKRELVIKYKTTNCIYCDRTNIELYFYFKDWRIFNMHLVIQIFFYRSSRFHTCSRYVVPCIRIHSVHCILATTHW